jgi:hypothetical protein
MQESFFKRERYSRHRYDDQPAFEPPKERSMETVHAALS